MRSLIFITLLALCLPVRSENPCGIMYPQALNVDWGDGAIYIKKCSHLDVYSSGDQNHVQGKLIKGEYGNVEYLKKVGGSYLPQGRLTSCLVIGHSSHTFISARDSHKGRFGIEFAASGSLVKGMVLAGAVFRPYAELLRGDFAFFDSKEKTNLNEAGFGLGVNLIENCLNIRKEPSLNAPAITCVLDNSSNTVGWSEIELNAIKGDWGLVKVKTYQYISDELMDGEVDCGELINSFSGWANVIDSNGPPNIWYSVSAY